MDFFFKSEIEGAQKYVKRWDEGKKERGHTV